MPFHHRTPSHGRDSNLTSSSALCPQVRPRPRPRNVTRDSSALRLVPSALDDYVPPATNHWPALCFCDRLPHWNPMATEAENPAPSNRRETVHSPNDHHGSCTPARPSASCAKSTATRPSSPLDSPCHAPEVYIRQCCVDASTVSMRRNQQGPWIADGARAIRSAQAATLCRGVEPTYAALAHHMRCFVPCRPRHLESTS